MGRPAMYAELAPWFHLLTPPAEYADDSSAVLECLREHVEGPLETLLELGSGGGNTASHLKRDLRLTLTDLAPEMLTLSRKINPELEHLPGDMRTLRLGRTFDAVLIHDAICYMTTEADLGAAFETAFTHLRPGGAAIFMPDHVRETFAPETDHGGGDEPPPAHGTVARGMRYLAWTTDPDPSDSTYQVDYAFLLREPDGRVDVRQDRHLEGLFESRTWLGLLAETGFEPSKIEGPDGRIVFAGVRPG